MGEGGSNLYDIIYEISLNAFRKAGSKTKLAYFIGSSFMGFKKRPGNNKVLKKRLKMLHAQNLPPTYSTWDMGPINVLIFRNSFMLTQCLTVLGEGVLMLRNLPYS